MTGTVGSAVVPTEDARAIADPLTGQDSVSLETYTLGTKPSANLGFDDIRTLMRRIEDTDSSLNIVTQGTDTLEESSFLARLLAPMGRHIVFTGAMRHATHISPDGPQNVRDALAVLMSSDAPSVSVIMNGRCYDPVFVQKRDTQDVAAFTAQGGCLGGVSEGRYRSFAVPLAVDTISLGQIRDTLPAVALWHASFAEPPQSLQRAADGAEGLVIAAFGAGHLSEGQAATAKTLAQEMPVILASRTQAGPVLSSTYGYIGAEKDLLSNGLVSAGLLDPFKARLALGLALAVDEEGWLKRFTAWSLGGGNANNP